MAAVALTAQNTSDAISGLALRFPSAEADHLNCNSNWLMTATEKRATKLLVA
jgi:hypothetical protein